MWPTIAHVSQSVVQINEEETTGRKSGPTAADVRQWVEQFNEEETAAKE